MSLRPHMKVVFDFFFFSKSAWVYLPFKKSCLKPKYAPMRMGNAKTIGVFKMYPFQNNHTFRLPFAYTFVYRVRTGGEESSSFSLRPNILAKSWPTLLKNILMCPHVLNLKARYFWADAAKLWLLLVVVDANWCWCWSSL